ncbi:peptidase MA family metallohydrolase [Clostridium uliginosum]|uniref:Peptidase MA superfamily protein n=1 Tax=Clostridium uliginosum TaxID=119641 RepID=A0A1I1RZH3_9CLOT|nr:peptidase MA family metallohydrolase [Clostridium uliginosum]SFD39696.1 Peptidase MA superfamily protein [Clostridium uliginosum]
MIGKRKEDCSGNLEFEQIYKEKDYKLNLRKETQHFIIFYTEIDKTCIDKVSDVLENNYNRITINFNQQLQEKLTIEIHSDLNQLHIALGFPNAPDWIRGGIGVGKIIIASPLNPPPGSKFDNVLNTAVHEFGHIIVNKINKDTPRWLNEGIACYEAKDNDENWIRKTVKNGLVSNMLPTFKDLDTGEDFETFFKRNGYQYSYTIVESIIEEYGYDKLYNLIKSPNNFEDIFGITENELQNKWMEYIKKNYLLT